MRKFISFCSAVLLLGSLQAQQESAVVVTETKPKGHPVVFYSAHRSFSFKLPSRGILQESHDGNRLFLASSKRSKLNGDWQSWYANGHVCDSGKMANNLPDGEWKLWDQLGNLLAVRTYDADKYQRVSEDILRYNSRRSFYTISRMAHTNRLAALHYLSAAYSFPGSRDSHRFKSLNELVRSNISGTAPYHPAFTNGLLDGLYMNLFSNGQAKDSGYYKDGLRAGKWLHRDIAGGDYWEGAYQDGMRTKEWKHYSSNGKLKAIHIYQKGEISWRKNFN